MLIGSIAHFMPLRYVANSLIVSLEKIGEGMLNEVI